MLLRLIGVGYGNGVVSQIQAQEPLEELCFQNPGIGQRMSGLDN